LVVEIRDKIIKIYYWVLVIFIIYLVIEVIRKIFGGSLGNEQLIIALLVANLSYSFYLKESNNKIDKKLTGHIAWHKAKDT